MTYVVVPVRYPLPAHSRATLARVVEGAAGIHIGPSPAFEKSVPRVGQG
jgi:hypothetical protein